MRRSKERCIGAIDKESLLLRMWQGHVTPPPYGMNGTSLADEQHQQRYWRSSVIIRSGLIKNHDTVDFGEFSKHWKDVHGPLARIVPRMKAYSQNHINALASGEQFGFHRVDGISQLRFDTVADMAAGMDSTEHRLHR